MKRNIIMVLLWVMLLFPVSVSQVFSADRPEGWKALKGDLYINERTITRIDGNTISAWIYRIPRKGSNTLQAAKQQLTSVMKDGRDLEYIGYLSEIDCSKKLYRKLTTIFFRDDRNIIASDHSANADWRGITSDSIYHDVSLAVCGKDGMTGQPYAEKE